MNSDFEIEDISLDTCNDETKTNTDKQCNLEQETNATSAPLEAKPKARIDKIKNFTESLPQKTEEAVESGKGNEIIELIQNILKFSVGSIFSSCRMLSMQQLLLSDDNKILLSKRVYIIAGILFIFLIVFGILFVNFDILLLALEGVLAAFIFDRLLNLKSKPNTKKKDKDDDYL